MRSKVAIVSILAIGVLMSGTGATLAFQGSSGQGNASQAQYAPTTVVPGPGEGTGTPGTGNEGTTTSSPNGTETLGKHQSSANNNSPDAAQQVRQEAATSNDDGKLPFTGLAAMPIIAIGIALLAAGALLQRRNSRAVS